MERQPVNQDNDGEDLQRMKEYLENKRHGHSE